MKLMRKYIKPQVKLITVETHALLASSGEQKISIEIDHDAQVVSGCSNQEGFGSIWD